MVSRLQEWPMIGEWAGLTFSVHEALPQQQRPGQGAAGAEEAGGGEDMIEEGTDGGSAGFDPGNDPISKRNKFKQVYIDEID